MGLHGLVLICSLAIVLLAGNVHVRAGTAVVEVEVTKGANDPGKILEVAF